MTPLKRLAVPFLIIGMWLRAWAAESLPGERILFETGFEAFEGYDSQKDLVGQNGWIGLDEYNRSGGQLGGNGLLADGWPGFTGQVAYIGYTRPQDTNSFFNVFKTVNLKPVGQDLPIIQFSVSLRIEDSTTNAPYFDDFRWSVYNTLGERLFSLDFENAVALENGSHPINYRLDDDNGDFVSTGFSFFNAETYDLVVTMNFARNLWKAEINGAVLVNGARITTRGAKLDIGDIDAVWAIRKPGFPGDNFLIFDDYRISATSISSIPPRVELQGLTRDNKILLRIHGEPGLEYAVDASADFVNWTEVYRGKAGSPAGTVDFSDPVLRSTPRRLYRARSILP